MPDTSDHVRRRMEDTAADGFARGADAERATIKELLSYRLHVVANLFSRGAAMRYKREFGVSLWEWRTLALLGAHAPLSLKELASAAGLDKSQMSRVVSGLIQRDLVLRGEHETDGRGVRLSLTRSGESVYHGLIRAARDRNAAFLGCLTPREREGLESTLKKLADQARAFIKREGDLGATRSRATRRWTSPTGPTKAARSTSRRAGGRSRGSVGSRR